MASVLSHVGQVARLPQSFPAELALTISRTLRLPRNRAPAWVLMNLKGLNSRSQVIDIEATNLLAMTRLALKSPVYPGLVAKMAAASMVPGVHLELHVLVVHPLQAWKDRLMATQMAAAKAKVLACLPEAPGVHRRDLQKRMTAAVRYRPSDEDISGLFKDRFKKVFDRLPHPMDIQIPPYPSPSFSSNREACL